MRYEFDPELRGLYVYLTENEDARSVKTVLLDGELHVAVDFDAEGKLIGVEVLGPRSWANVPLDDSIVTAGSTTNPTRVQWKRVS